MNSTLAFLQCNNVNELSELVIAAISVLDNEERGSLSDKKKVKSFLGRWYEKSKMNKNEEKCLPDEKIANKDDGLCIERDRIITTSFEIMISNDDNKEKIQRLWK